MTKHFKKTVIRQTLIIDRSIQRKPSNNISRYYKHYQCKSQTQLPKTKIIKELEGVKLQRIFFFFFLKKG